VQPRFEVVRGDNALLYLCPMGDWTAIDQHPRPRGRGERLSILQFDDGRNWHDDVVVCGAVPQRNPTIYQLCFFLLFSCMSLGKEKEKTHQDQFPIFTHTSEPIPPSFSPSWIKRNRSDECRMPLATSYDPRFAWREESNKIILASNCQKSRVG
jgi:hypothetical protein